MIVDSNSAWFYVFSGTFNKVYLCTEQNRILNFFYFNSSSGWVLLRVGFFPTHSRNLRNVEKYRRLSTSSKHTKYPFRNSTQFQCPLQDQLVKRFVFEQVDPGFGEARSIFRVPWLDFARSSFCMFICHGTARRLAFRLEFAFPSKRPRSDLCE